MKKLKSSLTNMLVVLTVIAIIAAGVLASVNAVTKPQIEKINDENLNAGIKKVLVANNVTVESSDTVYVEGKEKKDSNIQFVAYKTDKGTAVSSTENGFGGPLTVLVGFDSNGTILGYTVLSHSETPGLGAKANEWFQTGEKRTVIGKNPGKCNFTVSKDGGDIDAITASTITSRAFLKSIQNAYDKFFADADITTASDIEKPEEME